MPDPATARLVQLGTFDCPSTETIRLRQQTGRLSYRYLYAGNFSNIAPKAWQGAAHGAEIPIIMGTHSNYRGPSTALENATSAAFQDAYVAFARDPYRGLEAHQWQPYTNLGLKQVRQLGDGVAAKDISYAHMEAMCDGVAPKTTK